MTNQQLDELEAQAASPGARALIALYREYYENSQSLAVKLRELRQRILRETPVKSGAYVDQYNPEPGAGPVKVRTTRRKL